MSLCCSATFVSAQRDAPGRSLARAGAPGVQQHSYAPPFPPPAPPGRGEPHGSQDGYKRFQQQLWEQRQRGGPWAVKSRRNTERGIVASPAALRVRNEPSYLPLLLVFVPHNSVQLFCKSAATDPSATDPAPRWCSGAQTNVEKADAQMLQHAPIWMSWQSPYQLQTMLNDRGLVTVDLVPPTAEIGQVHVRGTVEASSDPVGAQRELGGAVSAAFGPALGLVVLPSEVVAVLVPRTKLEDVDPSVPLLLHKTDVNLIRTDARGMQVLVNPALTLVLHVGAARVHIYRMNEEAVTVMHQRVPLELLVRALLARPPAQVYRGW